jgi:hypothetical protein
LVATFEWDQYYGAGPTQYHNALNCNWLNQDVVHDGASDLITIEANKIPRGENSYTLYLAGHFSGTYTQIGPNGKLWLSTKSLGTGLAINAAMTVTYATPTKTATGDSAIPETEGTALTVQFGATPATATNNYTASNPAYSAYLRSQLDTEVTAATGAIGTNTITLKYDES